MSPSPQRELELENERLRRALDSITDGTLVLDRSWRSTLVSDRAAQLIGRPSEALLGGCVRELFPGARGTRFHEGFQRSMQTQQPVHFEAYYPAPVDQWLERYCSPARTRGGLGLGLAVAGGLVELHGGQVEAHSEGEGRGARFTVRVPASEAPAPAPSPPVAAETPRTGMRILVVEDDEDAAQSLGELLEISGHEVELAPGGAQALETAAWFQPRVVISDLGLPDMDGYAVARALRREDGTRDAFLIALSGSASEEVRQRSLEAGFDAHLAKPPDLPRLEQLLAAAVQA